MIRKKGKKPANKWVMIVILFFIFVLFVYFGVRSWILNITALAIEECKMNVAKESVMDCTIDKYAENFSFLGDDATRSIKARLKLEIK